LVEGEPEIDALSPFHLGSKFKIRHEYAGSYDITPCQVPSLVLKVDGQLQWRDSIPALLFLIVILSNLDILTAITWQLLLLDLWDHLSKPSSIISLRK